MSTLPKTVDCAPLEKPVPVSLSDGELRRLEPVRRVLLRPLDYQDVDAWRAVVNRALMTALDSDAAMFQLELDGEVLCFSEEFDLEMLAGYAQQIMPDLDHTIELFERMLPLAAGNRSMVWRERLEWLYRSDYWNELVRQHRSFDPLWAVAPVEGARYPAVLHTYHTSLDTPFFGPTHVGMMRLLQPALEAGVRTLTRTAASRASLTRSLDAQPHGALVYAMDGTLLHRNPAVARIAPTPGDETVLIAAGAAMTRGLSASDPVDIADPANATRTVSTRTGAHTLHAVRMGPGTFDLRPVVMVTVAAGQGPLPSQAEVRDRFGLTERQAEVALLLAERKSNDEIAELLCISPHTARHHTEAVMGTLGLSDRRDVEETLRGA